MSKKKIIFISLVSFLSLITVGLFLTIQYLYNPKNVQDIVKKIQDRFNSEHFTFSFSEFYVKDLSEISIKNLFLMYNSKNLVIESRIPLIDGNLDWGWGFLNVTHLNFKDIELNIKKTKNEMVVDEKKIPLIVWNKKFLENTISKIKYSLPGLPIKIEAKAINLNFEKIKFSQEDSEEKLEFIFKSVKLKLGYLDQNKNRKLHYSFQSSPKNQLFLKNNIENSQVSAQIKITSNGDIFFSEQDENFNIKNKLQMKDFKYYTLKTSADVSDIDIDLDLELKESILKLDFDSKLNTLKQNKTVSFQTIEMNNSITTNLPLDQVKWMSSVKLDNQSFVSLEVNSTYFLNHKTQYHFVMSPPIHINYFDKYKKWVQKYKLSTIWVSGELNTPDLLLKIQKLQKNNANNKNESTPLALDINGEGELLLGENKSVKFIHQNKFNQSPSHDASLVVKPKTLNFVSNFFLKDSKSIHFNSDLHLNTHLVVERDKIKTTGSLIWPNSTLNHRVQIKDLKLEWTVAKEKESIVGELKGKGEGEWRSGQEQKKAPIQVKSEFEMLSSQLEIPQILLDVGDMIKLKAFVKAELKEENLLSEGELIIKDPGYLDEFYLMGRVSLPWSLSVSRGKSVDLNSTLTLNQIQFNGRNIKIEDLEGTIPITENFNINPNGDISFANESQLGTFTHVDFSQVEPVVQFGPPLKVKKISYFDKNYGPMTINAILRQNLFSLNQFEIIFGKGRVTGESYIDLKSNQLGLLCRAQEVKISELLPKKYMGEDKSKKSSFDSRIGLIINLEQKNMGGRVDITRMSGDQLITMINVLDPEYENKDFNLVRKALEYGYPTYVGLEFTNGFLNMDMRINGIAPIGLRGLSVSSLITSQINEILSKQEKSL